MMRQEVTKLKTPTQAAELRDDESTAGRRNGEGH